MLCQPFVHIQAALFESLPYVTFEEVPRDVVVDNAHLTDQVAVDDNRVGFDAAPNAGDEVVTAHVVRRGGGGGVSSKWRYLLFSFVSRS